MVAEKISYLVAFIENGPNPAVVLRGTTSHSRTTLKINHPRQLFLATLFRLSWSSQAMGTACKESQSALIWLAVVKRDIEEQICHAELSCIEALTFASSI